MPIDQGPIGSVAMSLMDQVEEATGGEGMINAVFLAVEVSKPDGTSMVQFQTSENRIHIQLGLLDVAREMLVRQIGSSPD